MHRLKHLLLVAYLLRGPGRFLDRFPVSPSGPGHAPRPDPGLIFSMQSSDSAANKLFMAVTTQAWFEFIETPGIQFQA
jgi:hypothetical protein